MAFAEPHLGPAWACARGSIMMIHLGKGFWFMRGVPGKQDPMWDKTGGLLINGVSLLQTTNMYRTLQTNSTQF